MLFTKQSVTCTPSRKNPKLQSNQKKAAKPKKFIVHKWGQSILAEIAPHVERDNYHGIIEVFEDWAVIAVAVLLTESAFYKTHAIVFAIFYAFAALTIGARMRALADVLHQASHGSLANNNALNFCLGTLCSGYFVFQSFSVYHHSHVLLHHPHLGSARDPDYQEYVHNKLCGKYRSSENTKRYIQSILSPWRSVSYIAYVVRNRVYNPIEPVWETMLRFFFWGCVAAVLHNNKLWSHFLWYWVIPYITTNVWIGAFLELCEHYPMVDGVVPFVDIFLTKNRMTSWLSNFFLGIHWEGYHLVHHLFPKIPSWNYAAVHEILMKDHDYADLDHGEKGWLHLVNTIVSDSDN